MEPIKAEKLRAVKSYKKQNSQCHQFVYSLIVHSLIAVTCSLLCSYSYWFPSLYTIKHLLFMSLPNSCSGFFNPKCLFIVVNVIVVFLIGESRLSGKQSSPANEMYNEYVERNRSLRRPLSVLQLEEKKEERIVVVPAVNPSEDNAKISENKEDNYDDDHEEEFEECEGDDEAKIEDEKYEKKEEEKDGEVKDEENEEEVKAEENEEEMKAEEKEEAGLIPAEELNKRVEDFIARVNKQRWLEARFLVCGRA